MANLSNFEDVQKRYAQKLANLPVFIETFFWKKLYVKFLEYATYKINLVNFAQSKITYLPVYVKTRVFASKKILHKNVIHVNTQ